MRFICAWCGKMERTLDGEWVGVMPIDDTELASHGTCPQCAPELRRQTKEFLEKQKKEVDKKALS